MYPELYGKIHHKVRINYYPPRGDNKEGWDNIDIFGWLGYPMQIKVDFLCRDSILAAPIVLDLALFFDLAQRAGMRGIQEWLSFYFKSPMCAKELYPEHDLFIQLMKLKNTLRWMMGEDLITHLGASITTDRRVRGRTTTAAGRKLRRFFCAELGAGGAGLVFGLQQNFKIVRVNGAEQRVFAVNETLAYELYQRFLQ